MNTVNITFAFLGGIVSFLSPCVLPIIPGFLAYLAGTSLSKSDIKRKDIFLNSVFFVLGFSLVFAALGVLLNTVLAHAAYNVQTWLARAGGAIIIFFGLYLTGLIRIPFLEREYKFKVEPISKTDREWSRGVFEREAGFSDKAYPRYAEEEIALRSRTQPRPTRTFSGKLFLRWALGREFSSRFLTSFFFGAAFAAGWTPCVGAVLGGILGLAARAPGSAFALLFAYSVGLGVPFLAVGLFASQASALVNRYAQALKYVSIVFGVLLIGLGILAFTQSLGLVANFELLNRFLLK